MTVLHEMNFDGLVGPTHHYAGLSFGNVASMKHAQTVSNPKAAALQGLKKMRLCLDLGLKQGVLLPHPRPAMSFLREKGYEGDDQRMLEKLSQDDPSLFSAIFSASSMWTANAATVTPSTDTHDGKCHLTPANLAGLVHRSLEAAFTHRQLALLCAADCFHVHEPLLDNGILGDEGAANHTRLTQTETHQGAHVFVYGRDASTGVSPTQKYPARQTLQASETIAENHGIDVPCVFLQQNPKAIDAGVFHNDVIAVGNDQVFLYHELAFAREDAIESVSKALNGQWKPIRIADKNLSLPDAVSTYFFNSQLITLPNQSMTLILPIECQEHGAARAQVERVLESDNPINSAHFVDCRQSMRNGGGPACLRLRVPLTDAEYAQLHPGFVLTPEKITQLETWVKKHYRDQLTVSDLLDKQFRDECATALAALGELLGVESLYA